MTIRTLAGLLLIGIGIYTLVASEHPALGTFAVSMACFILGLVLATGGRRRHQRPSPDQPGARNAHRDGGGGTDAGNGSNGDGDGGD